MRILVGNHIDDSILVRADQRAYTQRILWFADNDDVIILSDNPDPAFLRHVTSLTGVDPCSLKFHIPPAGRFEGKLLDRHMLTDAGFLKAISDDLRNVSEIFALWPSPSLFRFASILNMTDRLPGAAFIAQGGGELANNKAYFRALAAACEIPIAAGEVCRTIDDAESAMEALLNVGDAVIVKQAQNGAGVGNQIVLREHSLETGHAGAVYIHRLEDGLEGVRSYFALRWEWASMNGRFPVVIEAFMPAARTVYAEYYADDFGTQFTRSGKLTYEGGLLTQESAPLRDVSRNMQTRLVTAGKRLAAVYQAMGYRGYMSADAIVRNSGEMIFTEMNARVTGSLHIYKGIGDRVVGVSRSPERTIIQYLTPPHWSIASIDEFIDATTDLGCSYDRAKREGVIVSIPPVRGASKGAFMFCVVYGDENEQRLIYRRLDERFGG